MQSAWKVGLFVLLFGALLALAFTFVGDPLLKPKRSLYYADFTDAANVQAGAIVTMAGVKIGTVDAVRLKGPTNAEMTLALDPDVKVPADSVAVIPTSLLAIGEQRIELTAGGRSKSFLAVGGRIPGMRASFLESFLPESQRTFELLNANLEETRKLLGDQGIKPKLDAVLASSDETIKQLGLLLADARTVVRTNQSTLREILVNASGAIEDLRKGIVAVNSIVADPKLSDDIRAIVYSLSTTASKTEKLVSDLNAAVAGLDLKETITATLANVERITGTGTEIADNAKAISADGRVMTSKMVELVEEAKGIAEEAKSLVEKLNKYADRLGGEIRVPKVQANLESSRNFETNRFQTNVTATYPLGPTRYLVGGIYDVTESNKVIAQYGQGFGSGSLRYGVYASKAGIGVDWPLSSRLTLTGDLFDPNDIKLNLRARLNFGDDWYGWIGADNLLYKAEPTIGFGIRR